MDRWAKLEQKMRNSLLGLLDHGRGPVDCILGVPVGEILLHDGSLSIDDGKHQRREASAGGHGQEFAALRRKSAL